METNNHHRALIALLQVPNLGSKTVRMLLKTTNVRSAEELFTLSPGEIQRVEGIGPGTAKNLIHFKGWDAVDKQIEKAQKLGAFPLSQNDPHYPDLLKQIYDPPVVLWVKGNLEALSKPGVAVVGTRNPGRYGLNQAEWWSKKIVESGLSVNSGLAYGIDSKAHQTTVENGGTTVAVLGSGIDWIYPERNRGLADKIVKSGGAVMTEYPPGTKPDAGNFPERNRIVSGMSHGVLVVESGIKGGSMITARLALDQNREVFVVPQQLGYLKGEGGNFLLKMGQGKLVQTIEDLTVELSLTLSGDQKSVDSVNPKPKKWINESLSEEQKEICIALENEPLHIDKLSDQLETEPFKLANVLLEMELAGLIQQRAGKYFELK